MTTNHRENHAVRVAELVTAGGIPTTVYRRYKVRLKLDGLYATVDLPDVGVSAETVAATLLERHAAAAVKPLDLHRARERIWANVLEDAGSDDLRDLLLELKESLDLSSQRHHKDGSRCYSHKCARAHAPRGWPEAQVKQQAGT